MSRRTDNRDRHRSKKVTQELLSSRVLKKFTDSNNIGITPRKSRTKDDINKVDLKLWEGYEEVGKMEVCPRCNRDDINEQESDSHSGCPEFSCECGLFWVGTDQEGLEEGVRYTSTVFEKPGGNNE